MSLSPLVPQELMQSILPSWFSPSLSVSFAGDARIEERVVRDVASYGRQIGWLSELVLAMAEGKAAPKDALGKLTKAAAEIDRIKDEVGRNARDAAQEALARLKTHNPGMYARLIEAEHRALSEGR
jgi:hypothetical protein